MATNPTIRRIPRDKLFAVFKTPELVKLIEDLLYGVGDTLPGNTAAAQQAADAAQVAADAAQVTANAAQATIDDHISDPAGAHAASAISVTPTGGIMSTDAQSALAELDAEIQAVGSFARSFLLMGA
jgi:NADH dehydrogenase FAD-containing subunit